MKNAGSTFGEVLTVLVRPWKCYSMKLLPYVCRATGTIVLDEIDYEFMRSDSYIYERGPKKIKDVFENGGRRRINERKLHQQENVIRCQIVTFSGR